MICSQSNIKKTKQKKQQKQYCNNWGSFLCTSESQNQSFHTYEMQGNLILSTCQQYRSSSMVQLVNSLPRTSVACSLTSHHSDELWGLYEATKCHRKYLLPKCFLCYIEWGFCHLTGIYVSKTKNIYILKLLKMHLSSRRKKKCLSWLYQVHGTVRVWWNLTCSGSFCINMSYFSVICMSP